MFESSEASEEMLIFFEDAKRALQTTPEDGERGACPVDHCGRLNGEPPRKRLTYVFSACVVKESSWGTTAEAADVQPRYELLTY